MRLDSARPGRARGALQARALQPLEAFIRSARQHSPDNAEARANLTQQQAQADVALGRVLPGVSARGNYYRNQYQSSVSVPIDPAAPPQTIIITPYDQLTGSATVSVTLVDLASFLRVAASRKSTEASAKQAEATGLQVESQVVQDYFQLLANLSLVVSSERALDVARTSLRLTQAQFDAGTATMLDIDRASAEVERQTQLLESANLQVALSARALESASGLTPESLSAVPFEDDLHPEAGLDSFSPPDPDLPPVAAAMKSTEAAEQQATAQRLALLPSITGNFTESATNAAGFVGHNYAWQAGVGFTWQLDLTSFANIRSQDAAAEAAGPASSERGSWRETPFTATGRPCTPTSPTAVRRAHKRRPASTPPDWPRTVMRSAPRRSLTCCRPNATPTARMWPGSSPTPTSPMPERSCGSLRVATPSPVARKERDEQRPSPRRCCSALLLDSSTSLLLACSLRSG